jgi:hypothetical protein
LQLATVAGLVAPGVARLAAAHRVHLPGDVERERPPGLDRSPEVFGVIADILVVLGTILALGIFRC